MHETASEATPQVVVFFAPGAATPPLRPVEWLAVAAVEGCAILGLGLGLGAGVAFLAGLLLDVVG